MPIASRSPKDTCATWISCSILTLLRSQSCPIAWARIDAWLRVLITNHIFSPSISSNFLRTSIGSVVLDSIKSITANPGTRAISITATVFPVYPSCSSASLTKARCRDFCCLLSFHARFLWASARLKRLDIIGEKLRSRTATCFFQRFWNKLLLNSAF